MDQRRTPAPEQTKQVGVPLLLPHPQQPLRTATITAFHSTASIFFWVVFVSVAVVVLVVFSLNITRNRAIVRLQQTGVTTQAIVVRRTPQDYGEDSIIYDFTAIVDGRQHVFRGMASVFRSSTDNSASSITVMYDPANPQISMPQDAPQRQTNITVLLPFCLIEFVILAGIVLVLIPLHYQIRSARSLDQHGVVTQGTVIDRWYYLGKPSGNSIAFTFVVPRPDGGTRTMVGAQLIATSVLYKRLQIGAMVKVRYLADNPAVYRLELPPGVF